jgi:hypothetical protein
VSAEVIAIWTKIQDDFRSWTAVQKADACSRILIPIKTPTYSPGTDPKTFIQSAADIDGWDVLPLFQGASKWLRSYPIYDAATGGPCATPSSLNPAAPPFDDAHESDKTCSDTVAVGGKCWLNGTVNYGTYGIMVRLCHNEFPLRYALGLQMAESLIRAYKSLGAHPEGATLPIAWVRATYTGGPSAVPSDAGNRPQCKCSCPCKGGVTNWDYVWEPVKPRHSASGPKIPPKPAAAVPSAPPPVPGGGATVKIVIVAPGDTLSKIAQKAYGDSSLWYKVYEANKSTIGANPNMIKAGQKLVIP